MSKTTQAPTAPNVFYLQWHLTGKSGGTWNGSQTASPDKFSSLDSWAMTPGQTYDLEFSIKQGQGQPIDLFVRLDGAPLAWGVRVLAGHSTRLDGFVAEGEVQLTAGVLISKDPKIKVNSSTEPPADGHSSVWLLWDGGWHSTNTAPRDPLDPANYTPFPSEDYTPEIYATPSQRATMMVTDATVDDQTTRMCALYEGDPATNTGTLYGELQELTPTSPSANYTFDYDRERPTVDYILNLFDEESSSGTNIGT